MEAAGIHTSLACEIDKHARAVLAHRFPSAALHDDVRTLTGDDIRRTGAVPERTILSGGFPCQPFSVAGRRRGMGGDDERGDLYWEISRILSEFPAQWVVLENVPGLLSIDDGRTFGTILGDLADLGYGVAYRVLDAQFFGVPQRRRRIFIVGCLGDARRPVEVLLEPEGSGGHPAPSSQEGPRPSAAAGGGVVGTLLANGGDRNLNDAEAGRLIPFVKAKRASTDEDDETWRADQITPTLNVFDNNSEARATVLTVALRGRNEGAVPEVHGDGQTVGTLRSSVGGSSRDYLAQQHGVRRLTPVECERLMGWPDDHTRYRHTPNGPVEQADSHRYKQCGNGMASPVVEWIARRILATEQT